MKFNPVRRICSILALACAVAAPAVMHADTFTYTYTSGATPATGTASAFSFSYTGTSLLANDNTVVVTDTCSVTGFGTARSCQSVSLGPHGSTQDKIAIFDNGGELFDDLPLSFFASAGSQTDAGGNTLTISDVSSGSAVPEPGSIALLGTGMLGFAGVIRRRLSC